MSRSLCVVGAYGDKKSATRAAARMKRKKIRQVRIARSEYPKYSLARGKQYIVKVHCDDSTRAEAYAS